MARASAAVHETFQRSPGVLQSHAAVVNDIAILISRILIVPGLERERSVNEIEVQIIEPQPLETRLESGFDALRPMIGVPQFCGDKDIFTRDPCSREACLQGL